MKCGLCGQEIGRVKVQDFRRRRSFCSTHCASRYTAILWLWRQLLDESD